MKILKNIATAITIFIVCERISVKVLQTESFIPKPIKLCLLIIAIVLFGVYYYQDHKS